MSVNRIRPMKLQRLTKRFMGDCNFTGLEDLEKSWLPESVACRIRSERDRRDGDVHKGRVPVGRMTPIECQFKESGSIRCDDSQRDFKEICN